MKTSVPITSIESFGQGESAQLQFPLN